jgi:gliding motility-associated-like protein
VIIIPVSDPNLVVTPSDTSVCEIGAFELSAMTDVIALITWYTNDFNTFLGEGNQVTVDLVEGDNIICAIAGEGTGCADTVCVTIQATDFQPGLENAIVNVCANTTTPLNPNGNPNYDYIWDPVDNLDLTEPWNPVVFTETDQTYNVTVTDPESGCSLETEITVQVYTPIIELETEGDTTLCEQVETTLTAIASGDGIQIDWYNNPALETVIGSGESITTVPPIGENIFVAVVTDVNGCQDTSWVHVDVILVEPNLSSPIVTCEGEETPLNPNGNPNLVYSWEPADQVSDPNAVNPTVQLMTSTTFNVTVTDSTGFCVKEEMVEVQVLEAIDVMAASDTTLCAIGAEAFLEASGSNDNVNYAWYDTPDFDQPPFSLEQQVTVSPDETTIYYVVASYNGLCADIDSVAVVVEPINAIITPEVIFCELVDSLTLSVTNLDPNQTLFYQWNEGQVASDPNQASVLGLVNDMFTEFNVTVTNAAGCEEVLTTSVTMIDIENILDISASPDEFLEGQSTELSVFGCSTCTYQWEGPGDISDPNSPITLVTPEESGTYTYTVTVTDSGCESVLDIEVVVREAGCDERHVFLPDAFTPNDDGVNDLLFLRSNSLVDMYLVIYNRWGQKMFETTEQDVGWDGTYKGEKLPPDVYGYYLKYTCVGETESRERHGNVSILR